MVSKITLVFLIALALATPGDSLFIKKKIAAKLIPLGIKAKVAKSVFKKPLLLPLAKFGGLKKLKPIVPLLKPIPLIKSLPIAKPFPIIKPFPIPKPFPIAPISHIQPVFETPQVHAIQHVQPIYETPTQVYEAPQHVYEAPQHVYEAPTQVYEAPTHVYGAPIEVKHEQPEVHFNPSQFISILDSAKEVPDVPEYKFTPSLGFTHYNNVKYFPIVQQPIVQHPVIHQPIVQPVIQPIVHSVVQPQPTYGPPAEIPYPPPTVSTGPYPAKKQF